MSHPTPELKPVIETDGKPVTVEARAIKFLKDRFVAADDETEICTNVRRYAHTASVFATLERERAVKEAFAKLEERLPEGTIYEASLAVCREMFGSGER